MLPLYKSFALERLVTLKGIVFFRLQSYIRICEIQEKWNISSMQQKQVKELIICIQISLKQFLISYGQSYYIVLFR